MIANDSLTSNQSAEAPQMELREVEGNLEKMDAELSSQGALVEEISAGAVAEDMAEPGKGCNHQEVELMNTEDLSEFDAAFESPKTSPLVKEAPWSGLPVASDIAAG